MIVRRFTQAEYFYLRNMKTQIEKSTPGLSDLYRNSFGAAKAPHFIFAYTKKIQSVNRHLEVPSETNTFLLKYVITLPCGHNVIYHAKWKQNLTSILLRLQISGLPFYHRQTDKIETKTNKQTKSPRSCSPILKKAGEKIRKERRRLEARYKFLTLLF